MFERFAHRSHELERLDTGDYTSDQYAKWLKETRFINRWLGDARALRLELQREPWIADVERVSILDIGAGSGELLKSAKESIAPKSTFLVGSELSATAAGAIKERTNEFDVVALQCNGTRLPFDDESFDLVICSLLLHHLSDEKAQQLIAEMRRVAKRRFIIIDLNRDPIAYYLYRIFSPLFLQRMTVEDGSLSILRSFRTGDLRKLADKAGASDAAVRRAAFRLILSGSKGPA